jgi:hypothetical protein
VRTHDAHLVFRVPTDEADALRTLARRRGTSVSAELRRPVRVLAAYEETSR